MRRYRSKSGFTLSELLIVMAVIIVLAVLTVPAVKALMESFESSFGVRKLISAALCNGRAIAAKEQCYAGVRFQQDTQGDQYMIFIIHDPHTLTAAELAADPFATGTGLAYGFRAVEGKKPVKLPKTVGVLDLKLVTTRTSSGARWQYTEIDVDNDALLDDLPAAGEFSYFLKECTTFSIVFSPTGKLVVHDVYVRNRHGIPDSNGQVGQPPSPDDIFNKMTEVEAGNAMFYQDDYFGAAWSPYLNAYGYGPEPSRKWFVIYDKKALAAANSLRRWSDYLSGLDTVYVNARTGEIVND